MFFFTLFQSFFSKDNLLHATKTLKIIFLKIQRVKIDWRKFYAEKGEI